MAKVTKAQFIKLQKKHVSDVRIGEALGISRQAVGQLRRKHGVASAVANIRNRDEAIAKGYAAGETGTSLAKEFGLSITHTYRIINAAKGKAKRAVKKSVAKAVKKTAAKKAVAKKTVKKAAVKKAVAKKKKKR